MMMKNRNRAAVAMLMCFAVMLCVFPARFNPFSVSAGAVQVSDLTFLPINYASEYSLIDCDVSAEGTVTVPSTYLGKPVTQIGVKAFGGCTKITNIILPDSVISIGMQAFIDTAYYKDAKNWADNVLYIGKHLIEASDSLTSHSIKYGTICIADYAFYECETITKLSLPNTIKAIGNRAFEYCSWMKSFTVPSGVKRIGNGAFMNCSNLNSVTIPDSVTYIGENAFKHTALYDDTSKWDNGVLYIGKNLIVADPEFSGACAVKAGTVCIANKAFYGCNKLTSVVISADVRIINDLAFDNCAVLESIYVNSANPYFLSKDEVLYNKAGTELRFFPRSSAKTSYIIPEGVTTICDAAFSGASRIIAIYLPSSLKSIGNEAFLSCTGLITVNVPQNVTSIGNSAFYGCTSLRRVVIPQSVTAVGENLFEGCIKLEDVDFDADVSTITGVFMDCSGLEEIELPESITHVGGLAFDGCVSLKSIVIPDGVTDVDFGAFCGCAALRSVTIPYGVEKIGNNAFDDCTELNDVYYSGEKSDWDKISIGTGNECLTRATLHAVVVNHITAISVEPALFDVEVGKTQGLTVNYFPSNATNKIITWSSDNSSVATVSQQGVVTAVAPGTAHIVAVAQDGGFRFSVEATVIQPQNPELIGISVVTRPMKTVYTYKVDSFDKYGMALMATYSDGTRLELIDTSEMNITGFNQNKAGAQTITVEYGGEKATFEVTVEYAWWQWLIRIFLVGFLWY